MTNRPPTGSRAPRWRLLSQPCAAAVSPLGGEDHQIQGLHRLHLEPSAPRAAGLVRRIERLGHDAFVASRQRRLQKLPRFGRSRRSTRRGITSGAGSLGQRREAPSSGSSSSALPSRYRRSKKKAESGSSRAAGRSRACGRTGAWWSETGGGLPSGRSATASPSRISSRAASPGCLDQLRHAAGDLVQPPGEDPHVLAALLWIWMRAPSTLYSSAASPSGPAPRPRPQRFPPAWAGPAGRAEREARRGRRCLP